MSKTEFIISLFFGFEEDKVVDLGARLEISLRSSGMRIHAAVSRM